MTDTVNRSFRYNTSGSWYKGNVHIHSNDSDGGKNFEELAEMYANAGYSFLFRTDHWVCSNALQEKDTYPVLWLDGVEIDGIDFTAEDIMLSVWDSLKVFPVKRVSRPVFKRPGNRAPS